MTTLMRWLLSLGLGYLTLVALAWALQGCMVHFPARTLVATPADAGLGYRDINLTTSDGQTLHGWFVPAPNPRGTLLFLHGNAGNISHRLESLEIFYQLGLSVLIFDYRGYGRSTGRPTETGLYRDAEAGLEYLREKQGAEPDTVVFFGRSLGAAVAAEMASRHRPRALILESAFTSLPDIGSELYPFLPVRWLLRHRYDTRQALRKVNAPVLIVHSRQDDIIPFPHGRALYEAAREPRRFLELEGSHNYGFIQSRNRYLAGLDGFLNDYLSPP